MALVGTLPSVAQIVRSDSVVVGFVVHMVIAAIIGAGFGLLVAHQRVRVGETVVWGLVYGAFWWFLGPQTVLPLLTGRPVAWDLAAARELFPSLIGHLFYGGVTAVVLVALRRSPGMPRPGMPRPGFGPPVRGAVAGLVVAAVLHLVVDVMAGVATGAQLGLGVLAGAGYPLLFGAQRENAGPALVRGTCYGFVVWVLAELTVAPLLRGGGPDWTPGSAAAAVDRLPPSLLLGAGIAVVSGRLAALAHALFVDDVRQVHREAPGGWGLRALGHGALAGLAGGAVFTLVLASVDGLPGVAAIMGTGAPAAGVVANLAVALLVGLSYALLFRGSGFDLVSGVGWGVSYGFFWWVLGTLTLLPALTGTVPRFDAATLASTFPALVGHLLYGAALGATYHLLEVRVNPWWMSRGEAEAARVAARREQSLGSAPALWGLTVLIALTLPLLVGG